MKPFGCPVTILNTRDHLGKFDRKADEGYFVVYYVVSKVMRVFNKRTMIIEETLNIRFLKNTTNVKRNGPDWLFDVDSLSISMNYVPVATGNKTNGPKDCEGDAGMKPTKVDENEASDKSGKHDQEARISTPISTAGPSFDTAVPSTPVNTVGPSVSTANEYEEQLFERFSPFKNAFTLLPIPNISSMDNINIFGYAYDDEDVEEEVDMNNVISSYTVPDTSFTKFHKDHPEDQVIGSLKTPIQTRHMTKITEEHGLFSLVHNQTLQWRHNQGIDKRGRAEDVARFQVTPNTSHLNAMRENSYRYLKGQPKLGLWYPRDSPFDLEAFFDSDYAGASIDRKSTTEGCQFLSKRLISWQFKKQTVVANSRTEAEYVAAANYCG
ncbi:hypothetical protein Tco_1029862 [Tanacetum coccineum]|uniref:Retroviral polymerase SH3-like domain-containing protein n=1 Tax=Tanacetum coccineum TaxID=301880 RepID=A0ABQ5G4M4_9ASTR